MSEDHSTGLEKPEFLSLYWRRIIPIISFDDLFGMANCMTNGDFADSRVHPRRGRPRTRRKIQFEGPLRCYGPQCNISGPQDSVMLLPEELEVLKLVDLLGHEQEEAAGLMGVSRRTAWRDLHEARRKVADALVHGKAIEIAGCLLRTEGTCPRISEEVCPKSGGGSCPRKWTKNASSDE
jgi:predicted DNA-binding protein (UPF0251 family)